MFCYLSVAGSGKERRLLGPKAGSTQRTVKAGLECAQTGEATANSPVLLVRDGGKNIDLANPLPLTYLNLFLFSEEGIPGQGRGPGGKPAHDIAGAASTGQACCVPLGKVRLLGEPLGSNTQNGRT